MILDGRSEKGPDSQPRVHELPDGHRLQRNEDDGHVEGCWLGIAESSLDSQIDREGF